LRCLAAFAASACHRRERPPRVTHTFEDIVDMPCIEIDFAAAVARADVEVVARLLTAAGERRAAMMITMTVEPDLDRGLAQGP
jgi:hypothetical protein